MPLAKPPTPNCDKMLAVREKSLVLSEFVDWLNDKRGYHICEWFDVEEYNPKLQYALFGGYSRLFADFFGIDHDELEREKQAILVYLRDYHAERKEDGTE